MKENLTEKLADLLNELNYHYDYHFYSICFVGETIWFDYCVGNQNTRPYSVHVAENDTITDFAKKVSAEIKEPKIESIIEKEWRWFKNHKSPSTVHKSYNYWEDDISNLYCRKTTRFDEDNGFYCILETRSEDYRDMYVIFDGEFIFGGIRGEGDFPERFRYLGNPDLEISGASVEGAKIRRKQVEACFTVFEFFTKKYIK